MHDGTVGTTWFREVQRFRQPWLLALLAGTVVAVVAPLGWGLVQQLVFGVPWGNNPTSNGVLIVLAVAEIAVLVGVVLLVLVFCRLEVSVDVAGVLVRFRPFHRSARRISPTEIRSFEVRTYRPVVEYAGGASRARPTTGRST